VPVLGTVFIILFGEAETYVARILKNKLFVGIGLVSYSAYLWHQPLFAYARILHLDYMNEVFFLFLSAVSFVLALASYRYIERPFRNKSFLTRKQVLIFSLVPIIAFSLFGVVGAQTQGFKNYITTTYQREFLDSALESPKRDECHTGGQNFKTYEQSCEYFGKNVKVAVLGDSHAVELSYALASLLQKSEVGVKHLSFSSCIPSYLIRLKGSVVCAGWTEQAVKGILDDKRIDTVVLSYRIAAALYGKHEEHYPNFIDERSAADRQKIWDSLFNLSKELKSAGKKVIYVLQAPELPRLIGYLSPSEASLERPKGVSRAWWNERVSYVYERLNDLSKVATIVDPADYFCDLDNCYVGSTNKAYYFDDDHMSVAGASVVAKQVLMHIEQN
jgi:hypothetical protein